MWGRTGTVSSFGSTGISGTGPGLSRLLRHKQRLRMKCWLGAQKGNLASCKAGRSTSCALISISIMWCHLEMLCFLVNRLVLSACTHIILLNSNCPSLIIEFKAKKTARGHIMLGLSRWWMICKKERCFLPPTTISLNKGPEDHNVGPLELINQTCSLCLSNVNSEQAEFGWTQDSQTEDKHQAHELHWGYLCPKHSSRPFRFL